MNDCQQGLEAAPQAAVSQAIDAAKRLLALLQQEASALAASDLTQLARLPAEKQPLLELLQTQQPLLQRSPAESLGELRGLLEQCAQANLRNGRVIHSQQSSTQTLLNLLRGAEERAPTYGLCGYHASARSRTLAAA